MPDLPSFKDLLKQAQKPRINRFTAGFDSDCDAGVSPHCDGMIEEGEEAGYVDDDKACEACCEHASMDE